MSDDELADLTHMLSLRGVLPQPGYTDKPVRRLASKAGGGRTQRKTMRGGSAKARAEEGVADGAGEPECDEGGVSADEEAHWAALKEEDERTNALMREYYEDQEREARAEFHREINERYNELAAQFYDDFGYYDD